MAVGFLTGTFRFIPRATLSGVIVCAMYYMLDFDTYVMLWKAKSKYGRSLPFAILVANFRPSWAVQESDDRSIKGRIPIPEVIPLALFPPSINFRSGFRRTRRHPHRLCLIRPRTRHSHRNRFEPRTAILLLSEADRSSKDRTGELGMFEHDPKSSPDCDAFRLNFRSKVKNSST